MTIQVTKEITEALLEEAIAVGVVNYSKGVFLTTPPVTQVQKYSNEESAPSKHGLRVLFENGQRFEVLIHRIA